MFQTKFAKMRKGKSYNKKHNSIVRNYDSQKSKHMDKLATKILKNDEKLIFPVHPSHNI